MRDGLRVEPPGGSNEMADDQRPTERRDEGVLAFIERVRLQCGQREVLRQLRSPIDDDRLDRSRGERTLLHGDEVGLLPDVDRYGDHVIAALLVQPSDCNRRIESARIRKHDALCHWWCSSQLLPPKIFYLPALTSLRADPTARRAPFRRGSPQRSRESCRHLPPCREGPRSWCGRARRRQRGLSQAECEQRPGCLTPRGPPPIRRALAAGGRAGQPDLLAAPRSRRRAGRRQASGPLRRQDPRGLATLLPGSTRFLPPPTAPRADPGSSLDDRQAGQQSGAVDDSLGPWPSTSPDCPGRRGTRAALGSSAAGSLLSLI